MTGGSGKARAVRRRLALWQMMLTVVVLAFASQIVAEYDRTGPIYEARSHLDIIAPTPDDPIALAADLARLATSGPVLRDAAADPTLAGLATIRNSSDPAATIRRMVARVEPSPGSSDIFQLVVQGETSVDVAPIADALAAAIVRASLPDTIIAMAPTLPPTGSRLNSRTEMNWKLTVGLVTMVVGLIAWWLVTLSSVSNGGRRHERTVGRVPKQRGSDSDD